MNMPHDAVKLHAAPPLQRPYLVAGWSGMGAVSILAINYLRQALNAQDLGEIDPRAFFSPSQVVIKDNLIQPIEFPQSRFYFCQTGADHDLIFFIGTEQPHRGHDMALLVLDTIEPFGVERIYTAAAFPTLMHHDQQPNVWGSATHPELLTELAEHGAQVMGSGTIGGLNGLLLAAGKERGLKGLCLLGEIPLYATQSINPRASGAVLTILTRMLNVEIDLAKMGLWAEDVHPQLDRLYDILPDHIKEALENLEESATVPPIAAETELVPDDKLFEDIERFLDQSWRQDAEDEDDESRLS